VIIWSEVHIVCKIMVQLMQLHPKTPPSLASFKSTLVLPIWYRLTQAVLEKRPLKGGGVVAEISNRKNAEIDFIGFCVVNF